MSLEIMKDDTWGEGIKFASSVWFLSGRVPISRTVAVLVDVPFVYFKYTPYNPYYYYGSGSSSLSDNQLGNPFFGLEVRNAIKHTYFSIGARLPVAGSESCQSADYATLADFNRFDAFANDYLTVHGRLGTRAPLSSKAKIHPYIGPTLFVATGDYNETELVFDYGLLLWLETDIVRVGTGFTGRFLATIEGADFAEKTFHQFGVSVNAGKGRFQPDFYLRMPLDDFPGVCNDNVWKYTYGINMTTFLN